MMRQNVRVYFLLIFVLKFSVLFSQSEILKGKVVDAISGTPIYEAVLQLKDHEFLMKTDQTGRFSFNNEQLEKGNQVLMVIKQGYVTKQYPITITSTDVINLDQIELQFDFNLEQQQIATISLSDSDLRESEDDAISTVALLQANKDIFLKAAAFDFSSTFFKPRGLGNENSVLLINGLKMNKLYNNKPNWSNWGGLNDVQRNQEFFENTTANPYAFGDASGTINIIMRASKNRKGTKLSFANTNRSYQGRVMGTYNSGVLQNGLAYSLAIARRFGNQGYVEGTLYDANSFFVSIDKKLSNTQQLNFTSFYTPNRRGKSTAITDEVFKLKGNKYNPNWGVQENTIRNARVKKVNEPILMVNHYWSLTPKTTLNTNLGFQKGSVSTSRIDTGGGDLIEGPDGQQTYVGGGRSNATNPVHTDNLPSSFLQNTTPTPLDYQGAYLAQQKLLTDGQLDWDGLLKANQLNAKTGANATYVLYDDSTNDTQLSGNIIFDTEITNRFRVNAALHFKQLKSDNFAEVTDLLGGNGFLDVDVFASQATGFSSSALVSRAQSDLRNPNRMVSEGDRFDYNYKIKARALSSFAQGQFDFDKTNFYVAARVSNTTYQREGLYENGYFPGKNSYGKSDEVGFINVGLKGGFSHVIYPNHYFKMNSSYSSKAPTVQNAFVNARQSNRTVASIMGGEQKSEKTNATDISYIVRQGSLKAKISGYYNTKQDATNIGFYFTEAISGSDTGFVQEILTEVDKRFLGSEIGITYQATPTLLLKSSAALGKHTYTNNPKLTLTSTSESFLDFDGVRDFGTASLKGYHIANGPQRAAQIGFEYRDPKFWWFSASTNYFSHAYINVSPFARTTNFYQDTDGLPFNDYDQNVAKTLLQQEKFDAYFLTNIVGGKSWKIKKYYVGFFASINNVFNQVYKTGGFEQARNANYRLQLEESRRDTPVFGSKYFFGLGTSYYINLYARF